MPHIHDKPGQHDLVVSIYILRFFEDEPKLLLHWHKKLQTWMQFGGHVELDEHIWQAVEHETLEETGYELSQLKLLQPRQRLKKLTGSVLHPQPVNINTHRLPDEHFHTGLDYAFIADEEPKHELGQGESQQLKWVTRAELKATPDSEVWRNTKEVCFYIFDEILPSWERVSAEQYDK